MQYRGFLRLAAVAAATILAALPALGQLPAEFAAKDIGLPSAAGSTAVDGSGVFTIKGSGLDIWDTEDHFQFAYRPVRGDGSITARILSAEGGHETWHKAGPMIRASDASGARNALLYMSSGEGLEYQWRKADDQPTFIQRDIAPRQFPTYLRVQRVGNELAGFASKDGRLWQPLTVAITIPMEAEALFGLAVTSHEDGELTTATFDQVTVQPGLVSPTNVQGSGGDRSVLLTWKPLPNAVGYTIYRGSADATSDRLTKLTAEPITTASYTDTAEGLVNGTPALYAVTPVYRVADGTLAEGAATALVATPVAPPTGFAGTSLIEGTTNSGSVAYDAATGAITIRASGGDIWDAGDQGYFLNQAIEGDFQITARLLAGPSNTSGWAKAGPMIRESLDPGARSAMIYATPANGVAFQWREITSEHTALAQVVDAASLKLPIVLRLTRQGNTISSEFSTDDGATFNAAAEPFIYEAGLPARLYVGLAATAHTSRQVTEARFNGLEVKKL
jgi:hypothetical protein